jgi:hypothetical protein
MLDHCDLCFEAGFMFPCSAVFRSELINKGKANVVSGVAVFRAWISETCNDRDGHL